MLPDVRWPKPSLDRSIVQLFELEISLAEA